ncbi:MAG: hypothetical protein ABI626_04230 [Sphingomicrobium sp.]
MTYKNATLHPAMTALAAVLAFSSTPLLAQSVDEPVVTTAPAVEVTPEPVAVEPAAPAPIAAPAEATADPLAPKATAKTAPVRHTATASRAKPTVTKAKTAAPIAATAPAADAAAPAIAPTPAPVVDLTPPPSDIAPAPVAALPADTPVAAESTINEMLPAAGIGGAAIILLAGAGLAVRRRRRIAEQNYAEQDGEMMWQDDAQPALVEEPAMANEPVHQPAMIEPAVTAAAVDVPVADLTPVEGPTTALPAGFDLSRFSPNVQAAYCGPTEDNASLSLKHRLSKASAMDQMERKAAEDAAEAAPAETAVADRGTGDFMFAGARKPAPRPVHTH